MTYLYADHLGTSRIGTDASKAITWRYPSDAFGVGTPSGTASVRLRLPGQIDLGILGVSYNYFRDYDPATGRYVESDPIGLNGGSFSAYSYVNNNPLMWADPYGLAPWDWDGWGDISDCSYYDELAATTKCNYYKDAARTCRGNNEFVNKMLLAGIAGAWIKKTTTESQSGITTGIRKALVQQDKAARQQGVDCQGCPKGNSIDAYHNKVFRENGINPFWYGGNRWPQGVPPNYVPYDPTDKPRWDPRRLWN